jgi:hypothetical protein
MASSYNPSNLPVSVEAQSQYKNDVLLNLGFFYQLFVISGQLVEYERARAIAEREARELWHAIKDIPFMGRQTVIVGSIRASRLAGMLQGCCDEIPPMGLSAELTFGSEYRK